MIVEYNKFNVLLYFLTGTTVTFVMRQWMYGIMILFLSACLLLQYNILASNNAELMKYQNITVIPTIAALILLMLTSLFVLGKSDVKGTQKLVSIVFLLGSIGFSLYKNYFKEKDIFQHQITNYISSLLFMVVLATISIIPDNQSIIEEKYNELRHKTKNL